MASGLVPVPQLRSAPQKLKKHALRRELGLFRWAYRPPAVEAGRRRAGVRVGRSGGRIARSVFAWASKKLYGLPIGPSNPPSNPRVENTRTSAQLMQIGWSRCPSLHGGSTYSLIPSWRRTLWGL